tara:strand:+ start:771 stop:1367 length:597 start_codon:yes stop_codon:yes gene_type:complete
MSGNKKTSLVSLNTEEKDFCEVLALLRYKQARNKNIKSTLVKYSKDVLEADREGVFSEMAFCKLAGVYPEFVFTIAVMSVKNGNDYGDVLYKGKSIDVKSTRHEHGKLISHGVNPNVDYYSLMVGNNGNYRLAGLMKADKLCSKERYGLHNVFKRECYKAEQNELMSWEEFKNGTMAQVTINQSENSIRKPATEKEVC